MSHVCRICSRVNPPDASFCYHDGVALDALHSGGPVAAGSRRCVLYLRNAGGGLLTGTVAGEGTSWLAFGDAPGQPQKLFQCHLDTEIPVHVVQKHLRAGNKPVEGRIAVETSGGKVTI